METKKKSNIKTLFSAKEVGAALPLAILLIFVMFINRNFFMVTNIFDVLRTASFSLFLAVPVTFLMASGGMDLSIGAVVSIGGVICGTLMKSGMPVALAILITLLCGCLIGLCNGLMVVKYSLPAFIATLAMQYCINGLNDVWTGGKSITNLPASFKVLGTYRFFHIVPIPVLYALIFVIIGHIILVKSKAGRAVLAVGGNSESARLAGINVTRTKISLYIITSMVAAFTGVVYAARFGTVQTSIGNGQDLTIIAAVIVGGTSMFGGSATIIGSLLGCILLSTIANALVMMHVSVYFQTLIFGLILIIALFIDRYRQKMLNS